MAIHLVTGRAGTAHVTAADVGSLLAGTVGAGKYVLGTGDSFSAEIISNNLIKIRSGDLLNQGRHIRISNEDYEECEIENGSQGLKRHDLIVMRYRREIETDIETAEVIVIKGTPSASPKDPEYLNGNILAGDLTDDFLLYRVCLNGISIEKVERMFSINTTLDSLYKVNNTGKVDLIWSNDGTNFNSADSYNASQKIVVPKNYDSFIILSTGGTVTHILNVFDTESNIISVLNIEKTIYDLFWAARKVCVDIAVPPTGSSDNYDRCLRFDPCYYRPYAAGGTFTLANACCVPFRIYGIRK